MINIRRFPHIMREKKTSVIPSNFVFFDCETKLEGTRNSQGVGRNVLWFGWACGLRLVKGKKCQVKWIRFTTHKQFFEFLESRLQTNHPLFVYAHNLGFDLTIAGFFTQFKNLGIEVIFHTFESPPTIFKCRWKKESVIFVDTLNYWTVSLESLGFSLSLPKLSYPCKTDSREIWDTYCRRDVEVIVEAVMKLCEFVLSHQCGSIGLTLAGLSMNAYRANHMHDDIYIHDRISVVELERAAYYGGLVNCFFIGSIKNQRIYNLDINSHYPSVMRNMFPTKLLYEENNTSLIRLKMLLKSKLIIAKVMLNSKIETFPNRSSGKLCYTSGRFETALCSPELERALKHNSILKVLRIAVYEKARIFQSFVLYFWKLRQQYQAQKRDVDSFFCKILLNSLYGKFGQKGVAWVDMTDNLLDSLKKVFKFDESGMQYNMNNIPVESSGYYSWTPEGCEEQLHLRNVMDNLQVKVPIPEHHESFPGIAAFVTAYAREMLLELISQSGYHNCFYCDTDSLFVNHNGYTNLKRGGHIQNGELGKLKIAATAKDMVIHGLKDYTFGETIRIKGIRRNATKISDNEYEQLRFEGLKSILRRGGEAYVDIETVRKNLSRDYDKGIIGTDGWVLPLRMTDF